MPVDEVFLFDALYGRLPVFLDWIREDKRHHFVHWFTDHGGGTDVQSDTLMQQLDVYKRELDACGKPFPAEFPMAREAFVARSREEAIRLARPSLEAKYQAYRDWGQDKVMPASDHFDLNFDDLVRDRFLIGTPAEVTEQIISLRKRFGVTTLILGVHWVGMPKSVSLEKMQLIAEEVFPAVRQAA